jgi:4-amino-4-deoxy-L-arabinose transferase-like glycosyltransferase
LRRHVLILAAFVLLIRAPFLGIPAQWDDFNYLAAGEYTLTNPAHPGWFQFVFHGQQVDLRGHPHPPGVAWILAALMAVLGPFREVPFHAAFLVFSFAAAGGMYALARRLAPGRALSATLLFLAAPASFISGTSFESDMPLLAFWMASMAFFVEGVERRRAALLAASALAMGAAAMVAYSAFLLSLLGAAYLWTRRSRWPAAWAALLAPFAVIAAYQLYERWTGGALPAGELLGHFRDHGFQRLEMKARNAVALLGHLGLMAAPLVWLPLAGRWRWALAAAGAGALAALYDPHPLFWLPVACGALVLVWTAARLREPENRFLAFWLLIYFCAALAIFFAGAARYLLPLAAPLVLLVTRALKDRPRWLYAALAMNLALGAGLGWVNAQHWLGSRAFVAEAMPLAGGARVWTSAEWGARYYAERAGAKALLRNQELHPGDFLLISELSGQVPFTAPGSRLAPRLEREIRPRLPLRIAGLDARAAYATVGFGLRALGWSTGPVDRLTLFEAVSIAPSLSWLPMSAPEAADHILEGVYGLEQNEWRWVAPRASFRLVAPAGAAVLAADVFLPAQAPGRLASLSVNGQVVAEQRLSGEGSHRLTAPVRQLPGGTVTVTLAIDQGFQPSGDQRRLGLILKAIGFVPQGAP